jgi:tripartite-type tricarboxylate transporter receptor subunit TctC
MRRQLFRKLALWATLLAAGALSASPTLAQDFPRKQPIKIVVPYNAGGGADVIARITADFLQRRLGQTVIVENRPGAGSAIGVDYVAKAPADGYTLLLCPGGDLTALPAVRSNLPYKIDQFTYLTRAFVGQPLLVASPKLPVSTMQELFDYMKANPGKVTLGTPGLGHIVHLGMAMLEGATGVSSLVVPYTGSALIYNEMLAGTIDITLSTPGFPDALKVLGSVSSKRSPAYPNLPTLEEIGIKDASFDIWFGFVAPPNLPKAIADRLIEEIGAVLKNPEAVAKFQASVKMSPEAAPLVGDAFTKRVIEEYGQFKGIVSRTKITVQ